MIKITINGEAKTFTAPLNVARLLAAENMAEMKIAVARNGAFVARGSYSDTALEDGDAIEIVAPMQGG